MDVSLPDTLRRTKSKTRAREKKSSVNIYRPNVHRRTLLSTFLGPVLAKKNSFLSSKDEKARRGGKRTKHAKGPAASIKAPLQVLPHLGLFRNKARHGTITFFASHETLKKFSPREQNINIHTNVLFSFVFLFLVAENVPLLIGLLSLVLFSISPNKNGGSYIVSQ